MSVEPFKRTAVAVLRRVFSSLPRSSIAAGVSVFALALIATAGSLTPSALPASTMHSLEELYDSIAGTFDSSSVVSSSSGSLIEHLKFIEENMPETGVGSDSIDFDELVDSMTLDANTSIASGGGFLLSLDGDFALEQTGNIGLGDTTPDIDIDIGRDEDRNVGLHVLNANAGTQAVSMMLVGQIPSALNYGFLAHYGTGYVSGVGGWADNNRTVLYGGDDAGLVLVTAKASASIGFWTGGQPAQVERMTILGTGNVGIGDTSPAFRLAVNGTASISSSLRIGSTIVAPSETLEVGGTASVSGNMTVIGNITSPGSGANSEKFGASAEASGTSATALGSGAEASASQGIAIGRLAKSYGISSIAIGTSANVFGTNEVAIGTSARTSGNVSTAVGNAAIALGNGSAFGAGASSSTTALAVGAQSWAAGTQDTAVGYGAIARGGSGVALGMQASTSGAGGIAIGYNAEAPTQSIAMGYLARSESASSYIFGYIASSTGTNIAFGNQVEARANTFVAGSANTTITNVYFGRGIQYVTPIAYTINGTGAEGTNIAGGNIGIAGGIGTGTGNGGSVILRVAPAGTTGATPNSLVDRLIIYGSHIGASLSADFGPTITDTFDLGSDALRWRDLYLASGSLHIGVSGDEAVIDYHVTSDSLSFKPDGTNTRFVIRDAGNVGIGELTPTALLEVKGGVASISNSLYVANGGNVAIGTTTANYPLYLRTSGGASPPQYALYIDANSTTGVGNNTNSLIGFAHNNSANGRIWTIGGGSSTFFGHPDNFGIRHISSSVTALMIDTQNRVAIGDNPMSATTMLDVRGTASLDPFQVASGSGTTILRVTRGGNVGIGDTTPSYPLEVLAPTTTQTNLFRVSNGSNAYLTFERGATSARGVLRISENGDATTAVQLSGSFSDGPSYIRMSTTRFGLHTVTPDLTLDVNGDITASRSDGTDPTIRIENNATGGGRWLLRVNDSTPVFGPAGGFVVQDIVANRGRFVIDTNGNVGIGGATGSSAIIDPTEKLEVFGNILASTSGNIDLILHSTSETGTDQGLFRVRSAGAGEQLRFLSGAGTVLAAMSSTSNFAVGNRLYIARSDQGGDATSANAGYLWYDTNNTLTFQPHTGTDRKFSATMVGALAGGGDYWEFGSGFVSTSANFIGIGGAPSVTARTSIHGRTGLAVVDFLDAAGSTLVRIASTGNVGINDSTPDAKLEVNGTSRFTNTMTFTESVTDRGYVTFSGSPFRFVLYGAANSPLSLGANGTFDILTIATSSNVGIGTLYAARDFHIASSGEGNILRLQDSDGTCDLDPDSGGLTTSCSSDERLKSDIDDASSVLPSLNAFRIREYTVNASGDRMTGVIAQEVLETHPELVSMGPNGLLMVRQPGQWELIKAIQELNGRIDSLATGGPIDFTSDSWFSGLFARILEAFESLLGIELGQGSIETERVRARSIELEGDDGGIYCVRVISGDLRSQNGPCTGDDEDEGSGGPEEESPAPTPTTTPGEGTEEPSPTPTDEPPAVETEPSDEPAESETEEEAEAEDEDDAGSEQPPAEDAGSESESTL